MAKRIGRLQSAGWIFVGMLVSSAVLVTPFCARAQVIPINTGQPIKHEEIQAGWTLASHGVCSWHCYVSQTQIGIIAAAAASLGIIAGPLSPWAGFLYGNIANLVVRDSFARIQALCRQIGCVDGAKTWEVFERPQDERDWEGLPQDPSRRVPAGAGSG